MTDFKNQGGKTRQLHIDVVTIHQFIKLGTVKHSFCFFSMTNASLLFLANNLNFVYWD